MNRASSHRPTRPLAHHVAVRERARALTACLGASAAAVGIALGGVSLTACATQPEEKTLLQADDLVAPKEVTFNRNAVIDLATLTDWEALSYDDLQGFFHQTPYGRASFLETYQSNGVRAADAILRAAATYKINPLVFLVRAQADQGLIGEQVYPAPPRRVEYAFECGCPGKGACDPALAGFDRQVDCLARAFRQSLDEMTTSEARVTAGGWGPNVTTRTIDGARVTPTDEGTAALYQYTPVVGVGSGGAWLFWLLFQKYAQRLDYVGPFGAGEPSAWIGDACLVDGDCVADGAVCRTDTPGGSCTAECATTACPDTPGRVPTFCAAIDGGAACLATCDPNVAASCREGYVCTSKERFGASGGSRFVCVVP